MKSLDVLRELFPGVVQVPFLQAAKAVGMAEQTAKNRLSDGTFPIAVSREGRRVFCHILNLAAYLDEKGGMDPPLKRGPRTKKERIEGAVGGAK